MLSHEFALVTLACTNALVPMNQGTAASLHGVGALEQREERRNRPTRPSAVRVGPSIPTQYGRPGSVRCWASSYALEPDR
jgi:hypothetical protein